MVVVLGAVQLAHLLHEAAVRVDVIGLRFEVLRIVGDDVQAHRLADAVGEIDRLEVAAGEHRRVDERVEVDRLVGDDITGAALQFQRGGGLPAGGQLHARREGDRARRIAGRIQRDGVPLQVEHVRRHDDAALLAIGRRDELERDVEVGRALRHVDLERVDIERIALPRDLLPVRGDLQARDLVDAAVVGVVAGQPLREQQRHFTGLHRDALLHGENALRQVGRIHFERDRARVRRGAGGVDRRLGRSLRIGGG